MDVRVKFGDSRSNRCSDVQANYFAMDEGMTADASHDIRQKRHSAFCIKSQSQGNPEIILKLFQTRFSHTRHVKYQYFQCFKLFRAFSRVAIT